MEVKSFLNGHCPYYDANHADRCFFCDGTPIGEKNKSQKKEPCKYLKFAGTFKSGCNHPNRHAKQGGEDMATDRQIAYYKSLCQQLGQEPDDDFENLTTKEASEAITELNEMLEGK